MTPERAEAPRSQARQSVAPAHLSVHLTERAPEVRFSFETRQQRLGNALGLSVVGHVVVTALLMFVAGRVPQSTTGLLPDLSNYDIVWVPMEGPGGGGGGGGNKSPEPPRKVELPGPDPVTVPVAKPADVQPKPKDEPNPEQALTIPAKTLASAEQTLPGVLESLPGLTLTAQGPGAGGGGGTGEGTGIGPGRGSGLGPGEGGGAGGGPYRPGSGITLPRPVREVKPQYTAEAMRAKVQGSVWLEAVVLPDGSVGTVQITKSLDPVFGLDDEAVKAARQWRFIPGTRFGQPVPVLVVIELTFTLR